ncbi:MAG: LAGLIDADG family homing endonuclease [Nanoarchaeota archaeon]
MKRYIITEELKTALRNNGYSLEQLGQRAGFQVKNLLFANKTIKESHLEKISRLLNRSFDLSEAIMNYERNLGKYAHGQPVTNQLKKDEHLAEFVGIMLGDGHFHKGGVKIAFDKRNTNYMDYVGALFKKITGAGLRPYIVKTTNQGYLYFYSSKFAEELTSFGLIQGDKIKNNVGIPDWIKSKEIYAKRCIRGLIDTDGCIYVCKREKQRYVKFTNFNRRLLEEFRDLALHLGYHFVSANKKNVCLYRKNEVPKFINDIKPLKAIGDIV